MATAASLPDVSIRPYNRSDSSSSSPSFRYMLEPSTPWASVGTVTISSSEQCSIASSAVMILVVLAIGSRLCAFCSASSLPELTSISAMPPTSMVGASFASARAPDGRSSAVSSNSADTIRFTGCRPFRLRLPGLSFSVPPVSSPYVPPRQTAAAHDRSGGRAWYHMWRE